MIGYVTLGTNDLESAVAFYDALLAVLDAKAFIKTDRMVGWGKPGAPVLCLTKPYDGERASVGNGVMIALSAPNPETVDAVYAKAMELGATDEGPAGPRGDGSFYGAYFRDLDGNKLNVHYYPPPA